MALVLQMTFVKKMLILFCVLYRTHGYGLGLSVTQRYLINVYCISILAKEKEKERE